MAVRTRNDVAKEVAPHFGVTLQDADRFVLLGYAPAFKSIKEYSSTAWVYFDVSLKADRSALSSTNGIAFELSSTVSSLEPPDIDRYDEPATDSELPF